jgi:hypothetical protein
LLPLERYLEIGGPKRPSFIPVKKGQHTVPVVDILRERLLFQGVGVPSTGQLPTQSDKEYDRVCVPSEEQSETTFYEETHFEGSDYETEEEAHDDTEIEDEELFHKKREPVEREEESYTAVRYRRKAIANEMPTQIEHKASKPKRVSSIVIKLTIRLL